MSKEKLVIIGAGGFGREVLWQILDTESYCKRYEILGFVDDNQALLGKEINNYRVIGGIKWLMDYQQNINAVICIANSGMRKQVWELVRTNLRVNFPTIIAGDVKYPGTMKIGKGCVVCLSSILTTNITIGDFVIMDLDCTVGHDSVIEDFVTLYPSVNVSGNVLIGSGSEIGTGTQIIQGKKICKDVIVGAGSVVVKDIKEKGTYIGVPAKIKG